MAGINAALHVQGKEPWIIGRHEGYIGVLVDDLVLKGADEPYRMFTSRAEYRLLLREDNADLRLSRTGLRLGLLGDPERRQLDEREEQIERGRKSLQEFSLSPTLEVRAQFESRGWLPPRDKVTGEGLLRRPDLGILDLDSLGWSSQGYRADSLEQIEIQIKYEGYIRRDMETLEGVRQNEAWKIPVDLDYGSIPGISTEIRERLTKTRPETLGQASRLPGITPASVATLLIYLKMNAKKGREAVL